MAVIAMQVKEALDHPQADTLRVYRFEAPGQTAVQVVANQDNVYAVGDVAAVALVGTVLADGMEIWRTKLREIPSAGMALGKTDAVPGSDLTADHGARTLAAEVRVLRWTSIELLHNVKRELVALAALSGEELPVVRYRAKVKLHGTNAGVQIHPNGRVFAQGRKNLLSLEDDNAGFARWVESAKESFAAMARPDELVVLYGEWCGPGIQKGVAINDIEEKVFAVFAVQLGDPLREDARIVSDPEAIAAYVPRHPRVHVLPWQGEDLEIDFNAPRAAVELLNAHVEAVEQSDPWVKEVFGVSGTGEGLVLYPLLGGSPLVGDDRDAVTELLFKAKGEKHRVRKAKKAVELDPEVLASIEAFVTTFATEARFEQGLAEACTEYPSMKELGTFLKWIAQDIQKEAADELAAGLDWKQVGRAVNDASRRWFQAKLAL